MKGELRIEPVSTKTTDLTGQRFGRLNVTGFAGYYYAPCGERYATWDCLCGCGERRNVRASDLRLGKCVSCGCHRNEQNLIRFVKHGHSRANRPSKEYQAWAGMINRCRNPGNTGFGNYGGRGITVCPAWERSFEQFLSDMGAAPSPHHSIERIDNSRGYSPDNCRWATRAEQARNTRATRLLAFNDETLTISEWTARIGCSPAALYWRIDAGWSVEEALTTPFRIGNRWREKWKAEGKI